MGTFRPQHRKNNIKLESISTHLNLQGKEKCMITLAKGDVASFVYVDGINPN